MADDKNTKEDRIELKQVFEAFKTTHEQHDAEIKTLGEVTGETKQEMERVQDALDGLETKLNAALSAGGGETGNAGPDLTEQTKAAFLQWCRKDADGLTPEEVKLLTRADDTTGGFLAPKEYVNEIIKGVTEVSPVRQVARIRTTSNHSVQIPTRTGQFAAQWVSEMGSRTETDGLRWGLEEISTHEMYALVDITQQNLEDSAFNLEAELNDEFVLQFAVTEGSGFVSGDGAGKPEGFLNNANIEGVNSGTSGVITADGLIDLYFALKTAYAVNSTWMLNRLAIRDIRKLKDQQDQYLWQPGLAGLAPATILDRPYVEATDMPVAAAASKSIALGDWRRGYTIVDRVQMSMLRDPYTQATGGAIRFLARRRVGGMTVLPEALKIQVLS
jgi:HK97 family phage major capsid protein